MTLRLTQDMTKAEKLAFLDTLPILQVLDMMKHWGYQFIAEKPANTPDDKWWAGLQAPPTPQGGEGNKYFGFGSDAEAAIRLAAKVAIEQEDDSTAARPTT